MRKLLKMDLAGGQHNPEVPSRIRAKVLRKPWIKALIRRLDIRPYLYVLVEERPKGSESEAEPERRLLAVVSYGFDTMQVLDRVCPDVRVLAECLHSLLVLRDPVLTAAWEADDAVRRLTRQAEAEDAESEEGLYHAEEDAGAESDAARETEDEYGSDHTSDGDPGSDEEPCERWRRRWTRRDHSRSSYFVEYDGEVKDVSWTEKEVVTQRARVAEYDALGPYFEVGEGVVYVMPRPPLSRDEQEMLDSDWTSLTEANREDPECIGRHTDAPLPGDHLWLYGVTRRHAGVTSEGFFGGPPQRLEACMKLRCPVEPYKPTWMWTQLSVRREVDGSLTLSFWPPVVLWIDPHLMATDRTLMVRVGGASRPVVLLDGYLESVESDRSSVRPCKMYYHGYVDEGCRMSAFRTGRKYHPPVAVVWSANVATDRPSDNYKNEARAVHDMVATLEGMRAAAATTITRAWRRCIACPEYHVCRKRLSREWGELLNRRV